MLQQQRQLFFITLTGKATSELLGGAGISNM
jgi:hypothetical protein